MLKTGYESNNSNKSYFSQSKNIFPFSYEKNISHCFIFGNSGLICLNEINGKNIEIEI